MPSSDFRIPNQMLVSNSLVALQKSFAKLTDLQDQASSLKRLRKPSDGPADVVSAMQLHAGIDRNDQYTRNLSDAQGWLGNADNALTTTVAQLQRVNDLVVQASNASNDANARQGIAAEIDSIRLTLIGVANTQYAGRPIFAGTALPTTPVGSTSGSRRRSNAISPPDSGSRST
jgi:flagellar hook-associated protein 3 FlgL